MQIPHEIGIRIVPQSFRGAVIEMIKVKLVDIHPPVPARIQVRVNRAHVQWRRSEGHSGFFVNGSPERENIFAVDIHHRSVGCSLDFCRDVPLFDVWIFACESNFRLLPIWAEEGGRAQRKFQWL